MRRTLTVVLATAALLAPAGAAFADQPVQRGPGFNASCSNGKGGNGATYSGNGNTAKALASGKCGAVTVVDPKPVKPVEPPKDEGIVDG